MSAGGWISFHEMPPCHEELSRRRICWSSPARSRAVTRMGGKKYKYFQAAASQILPQLLLSRLQHLQHHTCRITPSQSLFNSSTQGVYDLRSPRSLSRCPSWMTTTSTLTPIPSTRIPHLINETFFSHLDRTEIWMVRVKLLWSRAAEWDDCGLQSGGGIAALFGRIRPQIQSVGSSRAARGTRAIRASGSF